MHRLLTSHLPGTGGIIKQSDDDFLVTEIPAYLPCGEGEHLYLEIEKRGITTLEAIRRIGRALGVSDREIGYAGLKDSKGTTRQTVSIPRVQPEAALELNLPGIRPLNAAYHRNKLKPGHLKGNRFRITVRDVCQDAGKRAEAVLTLLGNRGVPNYFGNQRYGSQGNSHLIGKALVRQDFRAAVTALMGDPASITDRQWRQAVETFNQGSFEEAARLFPGFCRTEREVAGRLARRPEAFDRAFDVVNPRLKKLYLSAFQSWLFDLLLDERLHSFDQVEEGDLAFRHVNGACFLVEDAAAEAPRADRQEISPTGPLFGCRMTLPGGTARRREEALLDEHGLTLDQFELPGGLRMEGERRPFRVTVGEPVVAESGDGLTIAFSLPKGSYATVVMDEIMKTGPPAVIT